MQRASRELPSSYPRPGRRPRRCERCPSGHEYDRARHEPPRRLNRHDAAHAAANKDQATEVDNDLVRDITHLLLLEKFDEVLDLVKIWNIFSDPLIAVDDLRPEAGVVDDHDLPGDVLYAEGVFVWGKCK